MDFYTLTKTLHIISSAILFGTGIGIAFFMFRSKHETNLHEKFFAAKNTVLADTIFTLSAAIIQPITGIILINLVGYNWTDFWLVTTYILYVIAGLCWLPVVWIQIKMKKLLYSAIQNNTELSKQYYTLFKIWLFLGWPAFIGLVIIFYLMVAKPS